MGFLGLVSISTLTRQSSMLFLSTHGHLGHYNLCIQLLVKVMIIVHVCLYLDSSLYALKRELLLALEWINFEHHPSDLQLLFTGGVYDNITALSGVVSSLVPEDVLVSRGDGSLSALTERLKVASLLAMQLLTIRVG